MIIEDDPPPGASVPKYFVDTFMGSNFQDISSEQGVHAFPANQRDNPNIGYSAIWDLILNSTARHTIP